MAIKPPQSSIENFNIVWDYYQVADDDIQIEKKKIKLALSNPAISPFTFKQLDTSYSIIAAGIRAIQPSN